MNFRMKRRLVFKIFLLFSLPMLFAAPEYGMHKKGHKNFHGRRMMNEEGGFTLLYLKTNQLPESYNFELIFSEPVDPESINEENFLLNGNQIQLEKLRLSKNYRAIDFFVNSTPSNMMEGYSELLIKDIKSINGKIIEPVLIENFQLGQEYPFLKKR